MDAINGFKLLADSSDTSVFSSSLGGPSLRDPSFSLSTELAIFYGNPHNNVRHPLLGDDVQVVNPTPLPPTSQMPPPSSYHLPAVPAPVPATIAPNQPTHIDQKPSPKSIVQQHSSPKIPHPASPVFIHPESAHVQQQPSQPQQQPMQMQFIQQQFVPHPQLAKSHDPQQPKQLPPQPPRSQSQPVTQHPQPMQVVQQAQRHAPVILKGLINQEESESGEEEDEELVAMEDEEVKVSEMHAPLDPAMKNTLVCLIGEYLNEVIPLRTFLAKVRQCLCAPDSTASNKEVFSWILRCLLEGGAAGGGAAHLQRMAGFLEENGVLKQDIEASSAALKQAKESGMGDFDIGEKRKRREKKSISRGLRSAPNKWCKAESQMLIRLVHENGDKSWKRIAEQLGGGKTGAQCAQHWKRVLSPQIRKGSWDDLEEELLLGLVERYGQSWKNIASEIKTRTDIQCRYQYQKSCLSRQCEWQAQEDNLLAKKVAQVLHENSGSNNPSRMNNAPLPVNWVEVAKFIARAKLTKIPRTALECKQRWYGINGLTPPPPVAPPAATTPSQPTNTITSNNFHNISYSNINSNFTMTPQPQPTF